MSVPAPVLAATLSGLPNPLEALLYSARLPALTALPPLLPSVAAMGTALNPPLAAIAATAAPTTAPTTASKPSKKRKESGKSKTETNRIAVACVYVLRPFSFHCLSANPYFFFPSFRPCGKRKVKCSGQLPCERCVKKGMEQACVARVHRPSGPKPKKPKTAGERKPLTCHLLHAHR
jgi:hypothetical protein